jgi:hypothetical protein
MRLYRVAQSFVLKIAAREVIVSCITNLISGARLAVGLPLRSDAFRPSLEGTFVLLLVALAVAGVASWLIAEGEAYFDAFGAATAGCLLSFFLLYVLGVARVHGAVAGTLIATMLAAVLPWYVVVAYATEQRGGHAVLVLQLWGAFILIRALRLALPGRSMPAIAVTTLLALGAVLVPWSEMPAPNLFYGYEDSDPAYDVDTEDVYYRQPALVASATSALLPQTVGVPDLYFVGFAGDGESAVFEREAEYARSVLDAHYGTAGRSIVLSNDLGHLDDRPLANRHNLALALVEVAARMDVDEDALFLFLTSHGSADGELTVALYPFELVNLTAEDVRAALDDAGIRWRMIVISACHSGSFISTLRDERTVILTAAATDRQSFGCADDRELTYFGEALFRDALSDGADLLTALEKAREIVATREAAEELTPSLPQMDVGPRMRERLENLEGQRGRLW